MHDLFTDPALCNVEVGVSVFGDSETIPLDDSCLTAPGAEKRALMRSNGFQSFDLHYAKNHSLVLFSLRFALLLCRRNSFALYLDHALLPAFDPTFKHHLPPIYDSPPVLRAPFRKRSNETRI